MATSLIRKLLRDIEYLEMIEHNDRFFLSQMR